MGIRLLTKQECMELLASVPIGRVALTLDALPHILPVNYTVIGESVLFGAMDGSRLAAATDGAIIAFQADQYDAEVRSGWTVTAVGLATHIDEAEVLERRHELPQPWAIGEAGERFVELDLGRVSGHRVDPSG